MNVQQQGCFRSRKAETPKEYLQVALQAEQYIAHHMRRSKEGIYWEIPDSDRVDLSFYSGCAGILYFYTKLQQVYPNDRYKEIIAQSTAYLLEHLSESLSHEAVYDYACPFPYKKIFKKGLYFGLAGLGMVFLEVYRLTQDENAKTGAKFVAEYYLSTKKDNSKGSHWTLSPCVALDGGVILYLMDYYNVFSEQQIRALILDAGEYYLTAGLSRKDGALVFKGLGKFVPMVIPNWEFGNGGAGFVLLKLYEFTGETRYLQAAQKAVQYLMQIRIPQEKGYLIPLEIDPLHKKQPILYTGLCSGPVGTSRVFYQLYKVTGQQYWLQQIEELVDGMLSVGVPERYSAGLWNNVSYCCGHGGFVHFFLALYHMERNPQWLDLARRSAQILLGEAELDEKGAKWKIAWERIHPDVQTWPIGYFDGAAGIAAVLLELYLTEKDAYFWPRLIDDPFPEKS